VGAAGTRLRSCSLSGVPVVRRQTLHGCIWPGATCSLHSIVHGTAPSGRCSASSNKMQYRHRCSAHVPPVDSPFPSSQCRGRACGASLSLQLPARRRSWPASWKTLPGRNGRRQVVGALQQSPTVNQPPLILRHANTCQLPLAPAPRSPSGSVRGKRPAYITQELTHLLHATA